MEMFGGCHLNSQDLNKKTAYIQKWNLILENNWITWISFRIIYRIFGPQSHKNHTQMKKADFSHLQDLRQSGRQLNGGCTQIATPRWWLSWPVLVGQTAKWGPSRKGLSFKHLAPLFSQMHAVSLRVYQIVMYCSTYMYLNIHVIHVQ